MVIRQKAAEPTKQAKVNPPNPTPIPPSYTDKVLATMSLHDKVASLFVLHTPGTDPAQLAMYVTTYKPAGLILWATIFPYTLDELRAQTSASLRL